MHQVELLAKRLDLAAPVAALLVNRGHSDPSATRTHLDASPMGLHDPMGLPNMPAACARLLKAVEGGETILVHGDYDVDGVTGTSLLMRLFDLIGAKAEWHIPNRMTDGYSFGDHSIQRAQAAGATLVISVDNGTSAFETIAGLKERGIDTIVTDHHEPPPPHPVFGVLPCAVAIVNPKLTSSTYPFNELCGGAVAFKLAWAFARTLSEASGEAAGDRVAPSFKAFLEDCLSYVAIATLCDVVPLRDENRIFARAGLSALGRSKNPGLAALARIAGIDEKPRLCAQDVTFAIGPRINASGRLGSAQRAVELLLSKDADQARRLAAELDELNAERKRIEAGVLVEARLAAARFEDKDEHPVLLVAGQGWHQGVVGIVAARLVEEFGRPAIVIGLDGLEGRGSARSIDSFSVLEAMHGAAGEFLRYGGHAAAAGQVNAARAAIEVRTREMLATAGLDEIVAPPLTLDIDLPLAGLNEGIMHQIDRLEPFGQGNAEPIFLARNARLDGPPRRVGVDGAHLSLTLRDGARSFKGIAFRLGPRADELLPGTPIHVAYRPTWNTFRGRTNLELQVLDFQVANLNVHSVD